MGESVKVEAEAVREYGAGEVSPPALAGVAIRPATRHADTDISLRFFMVLGDLFNARMPCWWKQVSAFWLERVLPGGAS